MTVLLTDRFCERAPKLPEEEAPSDDFDEQLAGLVLSVSKTKKTWKFHATIVGKQLRFHARPIPGNSPGAVRGQARAAAGRM